MSSITRSVDEQIKSEEDRKYVKDEMADRVREEMKGAPRGSEESTARRGSPQPTSDLRIPSITGPNGLLTKTDVGKSPRGPTDGAAPQAGGPDAAPRSKTAANDDGGARPRDRSGVAANPRLNDGAAPGHSPLSQYDSLMQQGKSLSRTKIRERPGTVDQAGNVDPRKAKNPIGTIGLGATPRRYGTPRADSPANRSLAGGNGGGSSEEDAKKRNSPGSWDSAGLPRWQSGQMEKMPHLQRNTAPKYGSDPASRTYDPRRGY
jgi:hypothetical protein